MIENTIAQKPMKFSSEEHAQLTELLIAKDDELKATLKQAAEQAKINLKMEASRAEVERQDQDIQQLQRQLKEAEQILATAIYQAKQKLRSIARANKRPVPSEELIKYAHRISASNAICAPLTWQQGDPRRPYPTGKRISPLIFPLGVEIKHRRVMGLARCRYRNAIGISWKIERSASEWTDAGQFPPGNIVRVAQSWSSRGW